MCASSRSLPGNHFPTPRKHATVTQTNRVAYSLSANNREVHQIPISKKVRSEAVGSLRRRAPRTPRKIERGRIGMANEAKEQRSGFERTGGSAVGYKSSC